MIKPFALSLVTSGDAAPATGKAKAGKVVATPLGQGLKKKAAGKDVPEFEGALAAAQAAIVGSHAADTQGRALSLKPDALSTAVHGAPRTVADPPPVEKKPAKPHAALELVESHEKTPADAQPFVVATPERQVDGLAPIDAPAPVHAPKDVEPLLQLAENDPSLRVDLKANLVTVQLETPQAGALELEVRLRDGKADVRVDGPAAMLVQPLQPELRAVLAAEGLSMGGFSLGAEHHDAPERDAPEARETGAGVRAGATSTTVNGTSRGARHEGRIEVKA